MKKMMKNMSRNVALGMAALTLVSTCMGTAVKVHAAEPGDVGEMPQANIIVNGTATDVSRAAIKGGIGAIPVVGEFAAEVLDPLVGELFGLIFGEDEDPSAKIVEKIEEIKAQIDALNVRMDENTQEVLEALYNHSFDDLNADITTVRQIESKLFSRIAELEADNNLTPMQRNAQIGALLDTNSTDTSEFVNKLDLVAAYAAGTQVNTGTPQGLYEMVYKAKCGKSKLGGEAALRASNYVNTVNTVLENGYKLETMVLEARMVTANMFRTIDPALLDQEYRELFSDLETHTGAQKIVNMCYNYAKAGDPDKDNNMCNWKKAIGIPDGKGGYTGAKGMYESICNTENPNSMAGKYNQMVDEVWFDYIRKTNTDGLKFDVTYVELDDEMKSTDYQNLGIDQEYKYIPLTTNQKISDFSTSIKEFTNMDKSDTSAVITGKEAQEVMNSLESIFASNGENDYNILKEYGFKIEDAVKENSDRYGISPEDVDNVSEEVLMNAAKPILVADATVTGNGPLKDNACITMDGRNIYDNTNMSVDVYKFDIYSIRDKKPSSDRTYRRMLAFKELDDHCTVDEVTLEAGVDIEAMTAQIAAGLQNDGDANYIGNFVTENADEDNTDGSIVLTVDESGQITGDKMNEAWTVAEDGTIILNKDNKFRFEGTVTDKNIQNNGEIVDGNFKNVKLELVDNAVITKGTFEDCEITTNENAVIGEEVEFINTTVIDVKDIVNPEEEEQEENHQDVVEETPVVENDMF